MFRVLSPVSTVTVRQTKKQAVDSANYYASLGMYDVYTVKNEKGKVVYSTKKKRNPTSLLSDWIPAHAVRILPTGQVQVLKEKNPSRKFRNVEMGFKDRSGIFHPIRASEDYEEGLVGTHPVQSRKRVAKKKAKGKRKNPSSAEYAFQRGMKYSVGSKEMDDDYFTTIAEAKKYLKSHPFGDLGHTQNVYRLSPTPFGMGKVRIKLR